MTKGGAKNDGARGFHPDIYGGNPRHRSICLRLLEFWEMALSILRRYAPHFVVLGLLAFLWWRYSSAVEEAGRLEAVNSHLSAANQANTEAIEQLTGEIARRERVHREIQSDLVELRTHRQTLKDQLTEVNDNAPEVFRDCLAVSLPAEYISLRVPAKAD